MSGLSSLRATGLHLVCSERGHGSYAILAVLRWVMVLIFVSFGPHKFVPQFQHGITVYLWNSPLTSWMSVFGVRGEAELIGTIEIGTGILLAAGAWLPIASAVGALFGMCTFLLTWSFIFTTPDAVHFSFSTQPISWNLMGQFLYKDIVAFAVCLVLFRTSFSREEAIG